MTEVCPDCGSTALWVRSGARKSWGCRDCQGTFDAPDHRESNIGSDPRSGLSRALVEADPDDLSADAEVRL